MTTPIAAPFNFCQFWTEIVSLYEYFSGKISDDEQWFHKEQAYGTMSISDRENAEMARLGLDIDFDADDISTAEYMKVMKQRQDVQNRYQAEKTAFLQKCKIKEDNIMQQKERIQVMLENARAQKETWKEVCQNIDCSYFGD